MMVKNRRGNAAVLISADGERVDVTPGKYPGGKVPLKLKSVKGRS